ncbi:MAG: glyoxalase [Bacteroidetes bacterium GWF2_41_31]|nr:MAG: glyoxalase [Bacteroidetes bacterium GWF2_41_31]
MTTVNAYLTFNGHCEVAFNYYKSVFGGEFPYLGRYKEMPPMDGQTFPPEDGERIMHISLPISKETVLMGCDSSGAFGMTSSMGDNISLSLNTDSQAEADRLFNALSKNGTVKMPMSKTFWGAYFGMCTDQFGINWMVGFEESQPK